MEEWIKSIDISSSVFHQIVGAGLMILVIYVLLRDCLFDDRGRKNLPPGPRRWPFLGNLPVFARRPSEVYLVVTDLAKKYGSTFSLYFGSHFCVFFNDYDVIREAFVKQSEVFSDRPRNLRVWKEVIEGKGLGVVNGKDWGDIHRTAIQALRETGVGDERVEHRILTEAHALANCFKDKKGKPFDAQDLIMKAFSNMTFSVCVGKRFDFEDSRFNRMIKIIYTYLDDIRTEMSESFVPLLSHIRPHPMIKKIKKTLAEMDEFIGEFITDHNKGFNPAHRRDVLDGFLWKQRQDTTRDLYSDLSINRTIGGLLSGGIESTQMALRWLFLYFLHYPEIQKKCFDQIQEVLGLETAPSWDIKDKLPYVMATIHEVLRHSNIAALGVPHAASRDTTVNGYFIPKGTMVFMNLYAVHMDPKYWPEPHLFKPERWLDEQGKLIHHEAFIPFSIGRRHCLGEKLAKQELLLIVTHLLQRFEFIKPEGLHLPSLRGVQKLSVGPKDFMVCAKWRDVH